MRDRSTSEAADTASASSPFPLHAAAVQLLLSAAATAAVKDEHDDQGEGGGDAGVTGGRGSYKCGRCGQPKKGHKCVLYERGDLLEPAGKVVMAGLDQQTPPAASDTGASHIGGAGMQSNRHAPRASPAQSALTAALSPAASTVGGSRPVISGGRDSMEEVSTKEGDAGEGGVGGGQGPEESAASGNAGAPGARGGATGGVRRGVRGLGSGGGPGEAVAPPDDTCHPSAYQVAGPAALTARRKALPDPPPRTPPSPRRWQ